MTNILYLELNLALVKKEVMTVVKAHSKADFIQGTTVKDQRWDHGSRV